MRSIRFEEADSMKRTQIDEGLTRPAVAAGRPETGHAERKYFPRRDDSYTICGKPVEAESPFYLDPDVGEVLCEEYGRARRELWGRSFPGRRRNFILAFG